MVKDRAIVTMADQ